MDSLAHPQEADERDFLDGRSTNANAVNKKMDNRQGVDFNLVAERVAITFRRNRKGSLQKSRQNNSYLDELF